MDKRKQASEREDQRKKQRGSSSGTGNKTGSKDVKQKTVAPKNAPGPSGQLKQQAGTSSQGAKSNGDAPTRRLPYVFYHRESEHEAFWALKHEDHVEHIYEEICNLPDDDDNNGGAGRQN